MWGSANYADLGNYDGALTAQAVRWVVGVAGRAPSLHNSQPWRFTWDGRHLDLYTDWSRHLPVIDPDGRQLLVSCGAALFQARLALRNLGRHARISFPDLSGRSGPLARLRGEPAREQVPSLEDWALLAAVPDRRTTRGAFTARRLPASLLADLVEVTRAEGAHLHLVEDPVERANVAHTLQLADRAQRASPAYRWELHEWTRRDGDPAPDGVPTAAGALRPADPGLTTFVQRAYCLGAGLAAREPASATENPVVALLSTDGDDPQGWLLAGMALAGLLLMATCAGAAASLLNQAVDLTGSREMLRRHTRTSRHPQALLRLGYTEAAAHATPRRPVDDIFTTVGPVRATPGCSARRSYVRKPQLAETTERAY